MFVKKRDSSKRKRQHRRQKAKGINRQLKEMQILNLHMNRPAASLPNSRKMQTECRETEALGFLSQIKSETLPKVFFF